MNFARYYDEIYADKDYASEAAYVLGLMVGDDLSILDLGCGTGRHGEELSKSDRVSEIIGVDRDPEMIEIAEQRIPCEVGTVADFRAHRRFDAVISLFHVASYQNTALDLTKFICTASNHLKKGGRFIFDFWYGPAVLTDRPQVRRKDFGKKMRISEPRMFPNDNWVDVKFVYYDSDLTPDLHEETHRMRYWFLPELMVALEPFGLVVIRAEKWMGGELGFDSWYGCIVASKI